LDDKTTHMAGVELAIFQVAVLTIDFVPGVRLMSKPISIVATQTWAVQEFSANQDWRMLG